MRRWQIVIILLALVGCGPTVITPDSTTSTVASGGFGGAGEFGGAGGNWCEPGGGAGGQPAFNAIVVDNVPDDVFFETVKQYLNPPPPPGAKFLLISSDLISCHRCETDGADSCGTDFPPFSWELCIPLLDVSPQTINLSEDTNDGGFCQVPSSTEASGGDVYLDTGTLTITQVDASSVNFTLEGTMSAPFVFFTADGTYTAHKCF